jgi:hypothetical protein
MNPVITNVAIVSRFDDKALASKCIIDGAGIAADGIIPRGALLVKQSSNGKYHVYVHGTDTMALGAVRIAMDEIKVVAGQDAFAAAFFKGYFVMSAILDANTAGGLVSGDMVAACGFRMIETDEIELDNK